MHATPCEYLVSHGKSGAFGRFAATNELQCRRGDRVVIGGPRGPELGTVLCPVSARQQRVLSHTPAGQLLRHATPDDESATTRGQALAQRLFDDARRQASERALPLEILDTDVTLDGGHAVLQCLARDGVDFGPLLDHLQETFGVTVWLENLSAAPTVEDEHGGCGQEGCGRASGGGCTDCGNGGCSSCGSHKVDMRDYFAHLRGKMEEQARRRSLL